MLWARDKHDLKGFHVANGYLAAMQRGCSSVIANHGVLFDTTHE